MSDYIPPPSKYRFRCVGPEGCEWEGEREECWDRHQSPFKCPQCGKRHTFLAIRKRDDKDDEIRS